jgi:hypothetical protein
MATFITYRNISGKPITLFHKGGMKDYACPPNGEIQYRVGDDGATKGVRYGRVILKGKKADELIPLTQLKDTLLFEPIKEFSNVYVMTSDYYLLFWDEKSTDFKSYQDVNDQRYYIHPNENLTLLVTRNKDTNFFELKKDPIAGNCYQVDYYAGKNAWMPVYGLTEHAMPVTQHLQDIGESLGIGGDFEFNPQAIEDGYGISTPLSLPEVRHEVLSTPLPVAPAPAAMPLQLKVVEAQALPTPMKPKLASGIGSMDDSANGIPVWARVAYVSGFPMGLAYAAYKNSSMWGFVGWGLLGTIVGSIPYNYYKK